MDILIQLFGALFVVLFWSAVSAFIPSTLYLLVKNPPLYKVERMQGQGIFFIEQEESLAQAKKSRMRTIVKIFLTCCAFFSFVYFFRWAQYGEANVHPFNMVSALTVLAFWFSIVTYLPVAFYLFIKNPWKQKTEGICLTRLFIGYGGLILVFCAAFAWHWVKERNIAIYSSEVLFVPALIILYSTAISYLPMVLYILLKNANPFKQKRVYPNTLFVIYCSCFLVLSGVVTISWLQKQKSVVSGGILKTIGRDPLAVIKP
jgi:hypothetical protein